MFWRRRERQTQMQLAVRFTQKEIEAANALYADIMAFSKRDGHKLAGTHEPRPVLAHGNDAAVLLLEIPDTAVGESTSPNPAGKRSAK
jgi:hypothetical protein